MRKASYLVTFSVVAFILVLNILSSQRADWLVVRYEDIFHTRVVVTYGLNRRCEQTTAEIPGGDGKITYGSYECKNFPPKQCWKEIQGFCSAWSSAGYLDMIAIGFSAVSLAAIIFGITTHSRRRRIWRAVAGLVTMAGIFQIASFALITQQYHDAAYPSFERARPGTAYVLHTFAWVSNILIVIGLIVTGLSADAGHKWAAGNRAYQPISP